MKARRTAADFSSEGFAGFLSLHLDLADQCSEVPDAASEFDIRHFSFFVPAIRKILIMQCNK
jgi:hypothetical protein